MASISPITIIFTLPSFIALGTIVRQLLNVAGAGFEMESTTRSAILNHLMATYQGIVPIRTAKTDAEMMSEMEYTICRPNNQLRYTLILIDRVSQIATDALVTILVFCSCVNFMFFYKGTHETAKLAIVYALIIVELGRTSLMNAQFSMNFLLSAGRIFDLYDIEQEPDLGSVEKADKPPYVDNSIEFIRVGFRYYENEPRILNNISFKVEPCSKVAIIGPSGGGKSTIFAALTRLGIVHGKLIIGVYLFYHKERSDEEIWTALEAVGLGEQIRQLCCGPLHGLDYKCSGEFDFSISERQLLWMAKILLERRSIVLLDEMNSKVDAFTRTQMQQIISDHFRDKTVISIMHKIEDTIYNDIVIFIEEGSIVEAGKPNDLLCNRDSIYYGMMAKCGQRVEQLKKKCRQSAAT
ncbi:hypothetical protein ACOME3_007450 [Neoechinorhynchus agilis]